ncbi:hypothetical protein BDN72DRAFT_890754 [Pluteus cervinus]|uniref:Uncharacterized protein n=1 Tax=Pluteus cervinus TaxID=181527 RepID=A0ACD3BH17_9AGAR|nr:hypothetical protein BDN72DRAFT_890754 [Pluteus cervinus]
MSSPTESQDSIDLPPEFVLEPGVPESLRPDLICRNALNAVQGLKAFNLAVPVEPSQAPSATTIEPFANAIIHFLAHTREVNAQTVQVFVQITDFPFMLLLFDYRRLCRYDGQIFQLNSSTICVCWVDVLLSKLGKFSLALAKGFIHDAEDQVIGPTIHLQRENDSIKAATQLPEYWTHFPSLLASGKLSRAAQRLSLRLIFAVYIMAPQLSGSSPWTENQPTPDDMVDCAYSLLDQHARVTTPVDYDEKLSLCDEERALCAFTLCLLAAAEQAQRPMPMSKFRPRSIALIGDIVTSIMRSSHEVGHGEILAPSVDFDFPQQMLIKWGRIAPWFCSFWSERQNTWILQWVCDWITQYSTRQSINGSLAGYSEFIDLIEAQPGPLLDLFTLVLPNFLQMFSNGPRQLEEHLYLLICRTTWAISQILHMEAIKPMTDQISACAHYLLLLWISIPIQIELLQVKDHILEALTDINPWTVRGCIQRLQGERNFHFNSKLDAEATRLRRLLEAPPDGRSAALETKYFFGFMTILWQLGSKGCLSGGTIASLAASVAKFIQAKRCTPDINVGLLTSALYALSTTDSGFALSSRQGRALWSLALELSPLSLTAIGGFATFLLSAQENVSTLLCAEAWDLLRTTLLAILEERSEIDNPLALLVSPAICAALAHILSIQRDAASRWHLLGRPASLTS